MAPKRKQLAQRRKSVGHTQESLAEQLQVDRTTVVRWERGDCEPQPWLRPSLASALDVSLGDLDTLLVSIEVGEVPSLGVTVTTGSDDGGDRTDRRTFSITVALAGLGMTNPLQTLLGAAVPPPRLDVDHIAMISSIVDRFEQADAAVGGDLYCDLGIALHERLSRWEQESSYSQPVGEALRSLLGELECWIGWLALDAERRSTSRRYLQEAIVRARLRDDPRLEVRAMTYLCLLIRDGRQRESLQCAEAALRISGPWATPRLTSLLHLRAAHAQAVLGDDTGFGRHLALAKTHLDRGVNEDDPLYLQFVTPMELTGLEGVSHLALNRPERAARAFREITEHPDPTYRRNHGYYCVRLAEATCRLGDITGAGAIAIEAVAAVSQLRSQRTQRLLASLRADIGEHSSRSTPARDFVAAYDAAVTS